jgi:hypothetical protein
VPPIPNKFETLKIQFVVVMQQVVEDKCNRI